VKIVWIERVRSTAYQTANVIAKAAAKTVVLTYNGEHDIVVAIHDYETGMLDYGFRAVRNSLNAMHQTITDSRPSLMLSRLTLLAINALPLIKRAVASRLGEE
jgi:hypothetical protein